MFKYHCGSLDGLLSSHVRWAAGIVCCNPTLAKAGTGHCTDSWEPAWGEEMGVVMALGALGTFLGPLTSDPVVRRGMQYSPHFMDEGIQPQRG